MASTPAAPGDPHTADAGGPHARRDALLAIVPVRDGELPDGAAEAVAECGGDVVLAGSGLSSDRVTELLTELTGEGAGLRAAVVDLGVFEPARWAAALATLAAVRASRVVVLPGSPDGRDLAPRLAAGMRRRVHGGAVRVTPDRVTVARRGGAELHTFVLDAPAVATLQPGIRGTAPVADEPRKVQLLTVEEDRSASVDAEVLAVHPPDLATMDLAESPRILGGGAGLDDPTRFDQLGRIGRAIGAVTGATRVVTDRGWVDHDRQIGTTGVVVDPELYLAFGISGAVQHTSGLGTPAHVVSVNTDPHCPMMQLADLAVVGDANAVLDELERLLVPAPAAHAPAEGAA
jgi:electron transfer flavoprotein alpha subunit